MRRTLSAAFAIVFISLTNLAPAAEEGPTPDDIAFVQGLLVRFGYDPGPIDGICGDRTATAVRAFHEARSFPLEPGDIEPQAATVVKNLTTVFAENVVHSNLSTPERYKAALAGDADAALDVGLMYRRGDTVAADNMLAYMWWSVAATNGNPEAATMKNNLMATGEISEHEVGYAKTVAERICASAPHAGDKPVQANGTSRPNATM